jgi:RNA polymerase sigma-70 factor, ECF subfamily
MQDTLTMERPTAEAQAAWRDLYREHRRDVFSVCYSLLGNVADADNAVQDTFVKVARHLNGLHEVRDARQWLTRIAVRTCLDTRKSFWGRLFRSREDVPEQGPATPLPDQQVLQNEEHEQLRTRLRSLPEKQRVAVTLRYFHEMDTEAIAGVMRITPGSVKQHLHRAVERLKTLYEVEP